MANICNIAAGLENEAKRHYFYPQPVSPSEGFFLHNNRLSFEPDINGKKVPYIEMQKNFYTFCYAGNIIHTTITIQGVNVSNSN